MSSLTVRKLDIDLSCGFDRRWLGGDAYRTHFFNALSMSFPLGEQMFIDSLRAIAPERLADPQLAAQVHDFAGQEASHRFTHIQYNAQLARQGFGYTLEPAVARRVLRHPEWLEDADPMLRLLLAWHAVEEAEHKAVAFDAYRRRAGGDVTVKQHHIVPRGWRQRACVARWQSLTVKCHN